jgi:rSAM/selenodomain-associated transferase 2
MALSVSIIIPVLDEARSVNTTLSRLFREVDEPNDEVIVVDGDCQGGTLSVIDDDRVIGIRSPAGRAIQMNAGVGVAGGDLLLFLHADTRLPPGGLSLIRRELDRRGVVGGAFDLAIDSPRFAFRLIEQVASLRSRLTRIPYGDQAIFIRKGAFEQLGGFPLVPIMEDVALMGRIRRHGWPIIILPHRVRTSPRRWEREGALYTTLRNWGLMTLYLMGVSPVRLARYYRRCT